MVEDLEMLCKLILLMIDLNLCVIIVCVSDVLIYVEYGVVDFGVVGKDVLVEYGGLGLY